MNKDSKLFLNSSPVAVKSILAFRLFGLSQATHCNSLPVIHITCGQQSLKTLMI